MLYYLQQVKQVNFHEKKVIIESLSRIFLNLDYEIKERRKYRCVEKIP